MLTLLRRAVRRVRPDERLCGAHCAGGFRGDPLGELVGARLKIGARPRPRRRNHAQAHPGPESGHSSKIVASAALVPASRGKVCDAPPAGIMPTRASGRAHHAVVRREPVVALQRELESEARPRIPCIDASIGTSTARSKPHTSLPHRASAHRPHRGRGTELLEVGAGGEVVTGRGEHHHPHARIGDRRR